MKSFELNKNSWHYKAAKFASFGVPRETDFCHYFWMVLKGSVAFLCVFTILCSIGGMIGFSIANGLMHLFFDWELLEISKAGLSVTSACMAVLGAHAVYCYIKDKIEKMANAATASQSMVEKTSFAYMAYAKFKDKTCFKISFK